MNAIIFFAGAVLFPAADMLWKANRAGLMGQLFSGWTDSLSSWIAIAILIALLGLNLLIAKAIKWALAKAVNIFGEEVTGTLVLACFTVLPILWQLIHK